MSICIATTQSFIHRYDLLFLLWYLTSQFTNVSDIKAHFITVCRKSERLFKFACKFYLSRLQNSNEILHLSKTADYIQLNLQCEEKKRVSLGPNSTTVDLSRA